MFSLVVQLTAVRLKPSPGDHPPRGMFCSDDASDRSVSRRVLPEEQLRNESKDFSSAIRDSRLCMREEKLTLTIGVT